MKNKKEIVELYLSKGKTIYEIAKFFNCSHARIYAILKEKEINTSRKNRKFSDRHKQNLSKVWDYNKHFSEEVKKKISKNVSNNLPSTSFKKGNTPWIKGLTKETDKRVKSISDKIKIRPINELSRLKMSVTRKNLFNEGKIIHPMLGKKHKEETINKMSGENNHFWQGGKSFEPYTIKFNRLFKEAIRRRDNFTCLKCNIFEEDAKRLYNCKLTVHHIDYIKENTFKENCCALCLRCNSEVNVNREHWKKFFQSLLSERYEYAYSKDGNIILGVKNGS